MTCSRTAPDAPLRVSGVPNERQRKFFDSHAKYIAYGGARGGGKSWALRRKLIALCLRYPGIRCLIIRRTLDEVRSNHLLPMLAEYGSLVSYREADKRISLPGGSAIFLGYCANDRDLLRYQGCEYDIIAIDEATQLTEDRFEIFKACLRGTREFPRRIYLTCNPGGVGHAWVKRLFIDRRYREGEHAEDYDFIPATVYDNRVLLSSAPDYLRQLEGLPQKLRDAWLYGKWDVFEGQFLPEFDTKRHVSAEACLSSPERCFIALDYGLDMLAALLVGVNSDGSLIILDELCVSGLTLSEAAQRIGELSELALTRFGMRVEYAVASPDLWNRRQDSGLSGFEIMQSVCGMPPMTPADNRRVPGWRVLRVFLTSDRLRISNKCTELIRCLSELQFDKKRAEDAADEPHSITHAPEALRYAVMSRQAPPVESEPSPLAAFRFDRSSSEDASFWH